MARGGRGAWRRLRRILLALAAVVVLSLVTLLVLALVPVGTDGLGPEPSPRASPAAAESKLRFLQAGEGNVDPRCRSRLLRPPGKPERVVVLFHGMASCPEQMARLGRLLTRDGAIVLLPRAPRHGLEDGTAGTLGNVDAEDVRDYADDAIDIAAGLGDDVTVVGTSLGGTVAAWAAQERPEVDRAVVIAPSLALGGVPGLVSDAFTNVFARLPNVPIPSDGPTIPHAYPPRIASHPTAQVFRLGKHVVERAEERAPHAKSLAVVLNDNDHAISNDAAEGLVAAWRQNGREVTVVRLPKRLGVGHDTIDRAEPTQRIDVVYPVVLALAEGRTPPSVGG